MAIAPTIDVSFNKNKQLAPISGTDTENACGKIIYLKTCKLFNPMLVPASICYLGTDSSPALKLSHI